MQYGKFKLGQAVYIVTKNNKLASGIIVGFTDYSVGKQPIVALEHPNEEGWTHIVLTEALQKKTAFREE
jgi:hypothetical protein